MTISEPYVLSSSHNIHDAGGHFLASAKECHWRTIKSNGFMMVSYTTGFSSTRDATKAKHSAVHKCSGEGGVRISKRRGCIPTKSCEAASKQTYSVCDGKWEARSISAANFQVASRNTNVKGVVGHCCFRSDKA
uniref:Uncharacterized protein n=1 Tax=Amphora coffeiformis TaxID=265554 RepID=A0A7S3L9L8_9STRA